MDLVEAVSKGVREILFGELGLSEKKLLRTMKSSLRATKLFGKDAVKHPDFAERRAAAKDLLALCGLVVPTKMEVSGPGGGPLEIGNATELLLNRVNSVASRAGAPGSDPGPK
jgi:hypothetical protein